MEGLEHKIKEYLGANINLQSFGTILYIVELTDTYVKLDSRNPLSGKDDYSGREEITIHFDPDDEIFEGQASFKSQLKKICDWHAKHCKDCIEKREVPAIGIDFSARCILAELIDEPLKEKENL